MDISAPQPDLQLDLPSDPGPLLSAVEPGTLHFGVAAATLAGVVTLTLAGELDAATTPALRHCAETALADCVNGQGGQLVIECGRLSFIGAAGLGTLVSIQNLAARQGTRVLLTGVPTQMRELVRISRLEGHFAMTPLRN